MIDAVTDHRASPRGDPRASSPAAARFRYLRAERNQRRDWPKPCASARRGAKRFPRARRHRRAHQHLQGILDLEISSFGGDARLQQAMAADGIDVALGSGPASPSSSRIAGEGIAAMAGPTSVRARGPRRRIGRDGRRPQGSQDRRVDRRLGDELDHQRGVAAAGLGLRRHVAGPDRRRRQPIAALKTKSIDAAIVNLAQALNFVQRGEARCCCASASWSRTSTST